VGAALHHAHAQAGEPGDRIGRHDRRDDATDVGVNGGEIDRGLPRMDAEPRSIGYPFGVLARRDQRFGRHTAKIEAIASHPGLFDQNHGNAESGRCRGDGKAAGSSADHADIGSEHFGHPAAALQSRNRARARIG
jgi:hypothetical protein